jgi:tetratricopeptide (TPR) repeat protein
MAGKKNKADNKSRSQGKKLPEKATKDYSVWLIGISLLLTFIVYLPALSAGFVNWDDPDYVINNLFIRSLSNIHEILTKPVQGNYHPLTMLSLAMNYSQSGLRAGSYHVINLLFHLLNTFLVYILVSRLSGKNNIIAFTASLLFGIHPMHVESVAWIAERKDVLYAFFFLLGLIAYLKYVDDKKIIAFFFTVVLFLLSLASKPAAVIFPLALFTIDFFRRRKFSMKLILEKIPFLLFAAVLGYMTLHAQKTVGATDEIQSFPLLSRILFFFYGFMMYVFRLFIPVELGAFHPFPPVNESLPVIYFLSPLFFIGVLILCIKTYKKHPVITFGFAFYLVSLLLVLQFFVVGSAIISERYTYIPYIGLFIILGWFLDQKFRKQPSSAYAIIIVTGLVLTFVANIQAGTWKNSMTLWQQVITHNKTSALAYENLARYYREDLKDYDKALENFNEALKYERYRAIVYKSIGKTYFDKANGAQNPQQSQQFKLLAIQNFDQAIIQDSLNNHPDKKTTGEIYINRGSAKASAGQMEGALNDFNTGLAWDPYNQNGYMSRALYYLVTGNIEMAIKDDSRYLELNPYDADIYCERGVNRRNMGQFQPSLDDLNNAIRLKNTIPNFFLERARTYKAMGNQAAAKADAQQASSMGMTPEPELLR